MGQNMAMRLLLWNYTASSRLEVLEERTSYMVINQWGYCNRPSRLQEEKKIIKVAGKTQLENPLTSSTRVHDLFHVLVTISLHHTLLEIGVCVLLIQSQNPKP